MENLALKKVHWLLQEIENTSDTTGIISNLLRALSQRLEDVDEFDDIEPADLSEFVNVRESIASLASRHSGNKQALGKLPEIIKRAIEKPLPPIESRFPSVTDAALRDILDRDLFEAEDSLKRGRWKPAMVFCGSVLEAAMYEFLRRNPTWTMDPSRNGPKFKGVAKDITKDDIENQWTLEQLIEFFCENKLLDPKPETWKTTLHNFIRRYRNLVHPMAELRKQANQQVSEEAARQCHANLVAVLAILEKLPTPK